MGLIVDMVDRIKHRGSASIQSLEGDEIESSDDSRYFYQRAYEELETVYRGVNLVVDSAAEVDINITNSLAPPHIHKGPKRRMVFLLTLINHAPNSAEDVSTFRRQLYMDLVLTGNCYQYWDEKSKSLYHLPSELMTVITSEDDKVQGYKFDDIDFSVKEIIHTRDNSARSIYSGTSRMSPCKTSLRTLKLMIDFQNNFFKNGAIPGLIIRTPNVLGAKIRKRLLQEWQQTYSATNGARRPMLLDGDLRVEPITAVNFKELDFEASINSHELKILKALGVPPILLDSGNNANIRPNIQLFYETTVLPLTAKIISSYERFFAYDIEPDIAKIRTLKPELREASQYYTGLVNNGIMTINEARIELRFPPSTEPHANKLRIPQNIAGSATDPTQGGRPEEDEEEEEGDNSEDSNN